MKVNEQNNEKKELIPYIYKLIDKLKIGMPLHEVLTCEEINLPTGIAFKAGKLFKKTNNPNDKNTLNTNQLRKYFEQINSVKGMEINKAKKELYKVLPQIAYAAGRGVCPQLFYQLMEACITPQTLVDEKDIDTLIDFLTSIVAYAKYNSNGKGEYYENHK